MSKFKLTPWDVDHLDVGWPDDYWNDMYSEKAFDSEGTEWIIFLTPNGLMKAVPTQ